MQLDKATSSTFGRSIRLETHVCHLFGQWKDTCARWGRGVPVSKPCRQKRRRDNKCSGMRAWVEEARSCCTMEV
jgi:hypothetical protein